MMRLGTELSRQLRKDETGNESEGDGSSNEDNDPDNNTGEPDNTSGEPDKTPGETDKNPGDIDKNPDKKDETPAKKVTKKVETKKTNKASDTSTKSMIKYVPIEKVKTEGNFAKAVCFKPEVAPIVCGIVGIAMLFINNTIARVLGAFFIVMAGLVMFLVKSEVESQFAV